ncbi:uncharacterized protein [Rutidosis leptorrhynchoides]|uniref:uncharacterized protein n=1 Tax=Rutidosis leptorrhynchoides TaxID=125765 RepID=UPI003A9A4104
MTVEKPDIILLMETKNSAAKMKQVQRILTFSQSYILDPVGLARGLVAFWNDPISLQVVWDDLRHIHSQNNFPWLCAGDFNEVLYPWEKIAKRPTLLQRMQSFRTMLDYCAFTELEGKGCKFIWLNNRAGEELVKAKLDRMNEDPECRHIISKAWTSADLEHADFSRQVRNVTAALQRWSRRKFSNGQQKLVILQDKLKHLINQTSPIDKVHVSRLKEEIRQAWKQEEQYWALRSRIKWLNLGDKNTRFFHASTIQHQQRNRITMLQDENQQ